MDYCFLQDVFPNFKNNMDGSTEANISVGCTDIKSAARARKEQKKKAKKCKDPSLRYLEPEGDMELRDPDRPFLPLNKATEIAELAAPGATSVPAYFGASEEDTKIEGFAAYANTIGEDPSYTAMPSSTEIEVKSMLDKSSGGLLSGPSLNDAWKPLAPAGARSSFFEQVDERKTEPTPRNTTSTDTELSKKIDHIFSRLDQLEAERRQSTQTEVLLFVGSGLALLLSLDLLSRAR